MGKALVVLALILAVLFALMLITKEAVFVVLFFCSGAALIIATLIDRHSLLCPNCTKPPLGTFERGPATHADFCPHCYFWLKPPYSSSDTQV